MTTIKIDLNQGIIEASGDDDFVKIVYQDFKSLITSNREDKSPIINRTKPQSRPATTPSPVQTKNPAKKVAKNGESYSLIKDLDLSGGENKSLIDFFNDKKPSSNLEKNVVFVFYLKDILKIDKVTLDHVYTCYYVAKQRVPKALKQSLIDTSSKKGWLDTSSLDDITVPVLGQNLINFDLPRKSD